MKKINYLLFTIFISIFGLISASANIYGYFDDYDVLDPVTNFNLSYERYYDTSLSDFMDLYSYDMESYFSSILSIDDIALISVFKYSEDNYENSGFGLKIGSTLFRDLIIDEGYDVNEVTYVFVIFRVNVVSQQYIQVNSDSVRWVNTASFRSTYLVMYDSSMNFLGSYSCGYNTYITYSLGYDNGSQHSFVNNFTHFQNIFFYKGSTDFRVYGSFDPLVVQYIYNDEGELDNLSNESGRNSFTNWWATLFHGSYDNEIYYMYSNSYFSLPIIPKVSSYISTSDSTILFFMDMLYTVDTSSIPDDYTIIEKASIYNQGFYLIPIEDCDGSYTFYAYTSIGRGFAHEFVILNSDGVYSAKYFAFQESNLFLKINPFSFDSNINIDTIMNYYFYIHTYVTVENVSIAYDASCYTLVNGQGASSTDITLGDGNTITLSSGSSLYNSLSGYTLSPFVGSSDAIYTSSGTGISYHTSSNTSSTSSSSSTSLTDLLSSGLDGASSFYTAIMATMSMIGAFMGALPDGVVVALTTGLTLAIIFGLIKFIAGLI